MEQKSVLIGMSGGVDSSVAAALLKDMGYRVIGATMRLWTYSDSCDAKHEGCCAESAVEDARRVCDKLGIDFYVMNFKDMFRDKVVDYFVDEYIHGRTPNPCIACNKYLKFDALLKKATAMGIDYIATGHYAKIEMDGSGKYILRASAAAKKDQSYVLYNFTQEQLAHTLMPLGDYNKDWVRKKAEELGLAVAGKPDSQEICFVEDDDYARFITDYSGYEPKEGDILDADENIIGKHRGLIYYTIGQRKGIGAYGRPMFVMKIDADNNTITLGEKGMEFSNELTACDVNFISGEAPDTDMKITAKVRYQAPPAAARLCPLEDGRVRLIFDEPQRAVTPGQAVVFYNGDIVLGGGTVE
ncbi:MAG: tRNA 2-thiouridine(34) synthase MnmA [Oscillospiraceae bacterium]|nr:tRNA 2-thiouridine(34) synthase MnmA [Oscillospiraceae bacterium]